jgi:hypothetical protein
VEILATADPSLQRRLIAYKATLAADSRVKDRRVRAAAAKSR